MSHTPKPWTSLGPTILGPNDTKVASISMGDGRPGHISKHRLPPETEAKANQALILVAPDMREALEWAIGVIEICEKNAPNIDWSIGHHGRKARAKAIIAQTKP